MTDENLSDFPNGPIEEQELRQSIEGLLRQVPETWKPIDFSTLTARDERALRLLTLAGLVERKLQFRFSCLISSFCADVTAISTGASGLTDALEPLCQAMWFNCRYEFERRKEELGTSPATVSISLSSQEWRLTEYGVTARNDLDCSPLEIFDRRTDVFDFVFRKGPHAGNIAPGSGRMVSMTRLDGSPVTPSPVAIDWNDDDAKAFAQAIIQGVVKSLPKRPVATSWPGPPNIVEHQTIRESPSVDSETSGTQNLSNSLELKGEAKALALLVQHPEWSDTRIADETGCSRASLYRWKKYQAARASLTSSRQELPRGRKSAETGDVEAWD